MGISEELIVNLLVTLDRNYLAPLKAMLNSFVENYGDCSAELYILR